ncbi:MAG TPA: hypothetical protein VGR07_02400 [Thermoanaerobaculia bacterium]|jgi:hypothetical protein|nr:hypothetical protein [Thermoanaerobaculia bacterium]
MPVLSEAQHIILMQFHEAKGDRVGAQVGEVVAEDDFRATEAESPGVEFDGAYDDLLGKRLLRREKDGYALTQEGYDYLYAGQGAIR